MFYAVDPYLDQIRKRPEKRYCTIMKRFDAEYFDTEEQAKQFIIARAAQRVEAAKDRLDNAKQRHRKCLKRFK